MLIDVALTPSLLSGSESAVCVVVDVLRASTACVSMFDRGVASIAVAPTPENARQIRSARLPQALLCGEVGGLPPPGFDYGNSPLEFSRLHLTGKQAILATSNGTRALHAVAGSPAVFVGCLRNRQAVAAAAFAAAQSAASNVLIVCAGNSYGATFSLDDALTAGAIVEAVRDGCTASGLDADLTDAALTATLLQAAYPRAEQAFSLTSHGRSLLALGFGDDLRFCSELDQTASVPALSQEADGLLTLRRWVAS